MDKECVGLILLTNGMLLKEGKSFLSNILGTYLLVYNYIKYLEAYF